MSRKYKYQNDLEVLPFWGSKIRQAWHRHGLQIRASEGKIQRESFIIFMK
jgi:hypothetical protein